MTQPYDEWSAGGAEPALVREDATLAARLERDGAAWRAQVPPHDRLTARVRAIPNEQRHSAPPAGARPQMSQVEWIFEDSGPASRIPAGMVRGPTRRPGGWAAGIGAVVVVGMIAVLLLGARTVHSLQPAGLGGAQSTATPTPVSLQTPTATYGLAARYIANMITANGVDAASQPIEPTARFTQGAAVYVIVQLKNVPAGSHTLTVRWSLNGQQVQPPPSAVTSTTITSASVAVSFMCTYQMDGTGTVMLYWDLPANSSDATARAWIVRAVRFVVVPASGSPTPGPLSTPSPTP
jgi:hypothetical protein